MKVKKSLDRWGGEKEGEGVGEKNNQSTNQSILEVLPGTAHMHFDELFPLASTRTAELIQ